MGVDNHDGSHPAYDNYVQAKDSEIIGRGSKVESFEFDRLKAEGYSDVEAERLSEATATEYMAREKAGLNAHLKMATQVGGIAEYSGGRPLLVFNNNSAHKPSGAGKDWANQHNALAAENFTMDDIAGRQKPGDPLNYVDGDTGTAAFRAGVAGEDLPNDRMATITDGDDAGKFKWMVEDTPEALKIRADVLARDAIVRQYDRSDAELDQARKFINSDKFRDLRDKILSDLNNKDFFADRNNLPIQIEDYFDQIKNSADLDAPGKAVLVTNAIQGTLDLFEKADPISYARMLADTNSIGQNVKDFLGDQNGSVSVNGALSLAVLAASVFAVHYEYRASTIDTPEKSFVDWAVESTPEAVAALPLVVPLGGAVYGIAKYVPQARMALVAFGLVAAFPTMKKALENFVKVEAENAELAPTIAMIQLTLNGLDWIEKQPLVSYIAESVKKVINPIVDATVFAVATVDGSSAMTVDIAAGGSGKNAWLIGNDASELFGNEQGNILVHYGLGTARGGAGNDWLFAYNSDFAAAGEYLYEADRAQATRNADLPDGEEVPIDGPKAFTDTRLTLDGGVDDDWLIAGNGKAARLIGGEGNDWIFNATSPVFDESGNVIARPEIYGDTIDGRSETRGQNGPSPFLPSQQRDGDRYAKTPAGDWSRDSDIIWWWPDVVVRDAAHNDLLKFFGLPLTGGSNSLPVLYNGASRALGLSAGGETFDKSIFLDHLFPFIYYVRDEKSGVMTVVNALSGVLGGIAKLFVSEDTFGDVEGTAIESTGSGAMAIDNFSVPRYVFGFNPFVNPVTANFLSDDRTGTFNMFFKNANPFYEILNLLPPLPGTGGLFNILPAVDDALFLEEAAKRFAKATKWSPDKDPLVFDLDGDGLESVSLRSSGVSFDIDSDLFGEGTGWLSADDGFLAIDLNGNGRIDGIEELFGDETIGGFEALSVYDSDGDGAITAADAVWADLRIWQDLNQDGKSGTIEDGDQDELSTLDELDIVTIDLASVELTGFTPQGTEIRRAGGFEYGDGTRNEVLEAIFPTDDIRTEYLGETGIAPWLADLPVNAKGFGRITDLAVSLSNDMDMADALRAASSDLTIPNLKTLREAIGPVLDRWSVTLEQTRELTPVLLSTNSDTVQLVDRAVYVENNASGYWTLASDASILDANGVAIAEPTLEDVLAQATADGSVWQLEQLFSPSSRQDNLQHRTEVPYLVEIVDGRAVVLDHGIRGVDGSWTLASGTPILDAQGTIIEAATKADITAQATADGQEWRVEEISFNPFAAIDIENIGVRFLDGEVVDYTVEMTDEDGSFYVWARNLDRALELQVLKGENNNFNLRNYEVDFDRLDEVDSTSDSRFRVELLSPNQFHLATSLIGIDFQPAMLSGEIDDVTGAISYSVNSSGDVSLSDVGYTSGIDAMIGLLGTMMDGYLAIESSFAVRAALATGLSQYARGVTYDAADDVFRGDGRELAPMFEAIFETMPAGYDAAFDYLTDWNELLFEVYSHFETAGGANAGGLGVSIDQRFILQMMLPAFEATDTELDLPAALNALAVDESNLRQHLADATEVAGTDGTDLFHISSGDQTFTGGLGSDTYVVGQDFGRDIIRDLDQGSFDDLRFSSLSADDVTSLRDGEDMIITVTETGEEIRLIDQFLGELNEYYSSGEQAETGVNVIVFADGEIWDRFEMAIQVADPRDTDDAYVGSGSGDVLFGGKGNDALTGGAGGDYYIFTRGDGQDVVNDRGNFSFGPVEAGIDFIQFVGDISSSDLKLVRDGASDDLLITLLDKDGVETSDTIKVVGQLGGIELNLQAWEQVSPGLGVTYVSPALIERFIFGDGTSLEFTEIADRVLENARTDGDDAIYGMVNDNVLDGGAGNDYLTGFFGSDTYVFERGYGHDVIEDNDTASKLFGNTPDTLEFRGGIDWTDLEFSRDGDTDTLTITIVGTEDAVTLVDFLLNFEFIGFVNVIETITFDNDVEWSYLDLLQKFIDAERTDGDDSIYGFRSDDVIEGGLGNDTLEGHGGNDTYLFSRGSGHDTIYEDTYDKGPLSTEKAGEDTLVFDGISASDVDFTRTDLDLIITVRDTGESITIRDQYVRAEQQTHAVERFEFSDATLLFSNFNPEDIDLVGTAADETITGSNFSEVLDGRAGNDTLIGRDGGDIYRFDVGYGEDLIIDVQERSGWEDRRGTDVPTDDVVQFGDEITRDNVVFTRSGDDLVITVEQRTDILRIRNQFADEINGIERFEFVGDGFLDRRDIEELLQIEAGNRGDNIITGLENQPNSFDGGQGDDLLIGGLAADTYAFGIGSDFDTIEERADAAGVIDRIVFGQSVNADGLILRRNDNDLLIDIGNGTDVLTIVDGLGATTVEHFEFADGSVLTLDQIRDDLLIGDETSQRIVGFDGRDDRIEGGAGSDSLEGGLGDDTYTFGFGQGNAVIRETGGIDRIEFGTGVTRDQISFREVDGDLMMTLVNSGQTIVVLGGAMLGEAGGLVEEFAFPSGDVLALTDIIAIAREGATNIGSDIIDLTSPFAAPEAAPGFGNDLVLMGADTKVTFKSGGGLDTVVLPDVQGGAELFFADAYSDQVSVRVDGQSSGDLTILVPESGDEVVLRDAVDASELPIIRFADGETWTAEQLFARAVETQQTDGSDLVFGSVGADTLEGGSGDDDIRGGAGDDTYIFRRGDGRDVLTDDRREEVGGTDRLEIRGYLAEEMQVSRVGGSNEEIVLTFDGTNDEIVLRGRIETVAFGDGTEFAIDDLISTAVGQGTAYANELTGTLGNDVFEGGRGDDVLRGLDGSDIYIFRRGDGADIITDPRSATNGDKIVLADHFVSELKVRGVEGSANDLLMLLGNGDQIILVNGLNRFSRSIDRFEFNGGTVWTHAQIIDLYDRTNAASDADIITGTSGDDVLTGTNGNDVFQPGYNDADTIVIERGAGRDIVIEATVPQSRVELRGYDLSELLISSVPDTTRDILIRFAGTADEVVIERPAQYTFSGADRDTTRPFLIADDGALSIDDLTAALSVTTGDVGNNTLRDPNSGSSSSVFDGGFGDDTISTGEGQDTIRFARGDGRDTIEAKVVFAFTSDTLELSGYLPDDVILTAHPFEPLGFIVTFVGTDDEIVVRSTSSLLRARVTKIEFDDGTIWSSSDIAARTGPAAFAEPNEILDQPTDGLPIEMGAGDDYVRTVDTDDMYIYRNGDGRDVYFDEGTNSAQGADIVEFADLLIGDVKFERRGDSFAVVIEADAARGIIAGSITISDALIGTRGQIEIFRFSDGEEIGLATAIAQSIRDDATQGADTITGTAGDDEISGDGGSDLLFGGEGNDTYVWSRGDGHDEISDIGGVDRLRLAGVTEGDLFFEQASRGLIVTIAATSAGSDGGTVILLGDPLGTAIESIELEDGTIIDSDAISARLIAQQASVFDDRITGFATGDTLAGGLGDDTLLGGDGADTYTYARGDSSDIISDVSTDGAVDTLKLVGIDPSDVSLRIGFDDGRSTGGGADLNVIIAPTITDGIDGGRVTVRNSLDSDDTRGIEAIVFDDGTVWQRSDFATLIGRNIGTGNDDLLIGTTGDDDLTGLGGNDSLLGGEGDDTYFYSRGDGLDSIEDASGSTDRLEIAGYALSELTFASRGLEGSELIIRLAQFDDEITIIGGLSNGANRIEQIVLSDSGETLSLNDIRAIMLAQSASDSNDTILGSTGDDVLRGGVGDDVLQGNDGTDTYIYRAGDGDDRIIDIAPNRSSLHSSLIELPDHNVDDIAYVTRGGPDSDDLVIMFGGERDRLIIERALTPRANEDTITFADGTVWTADDMRAATMATSSTSGDDKIYGFAGDDTFLSTTGDDTMWGRDGDDLYQFARGSGQDTIYDTVEAGGSDRVEFLDFVSSEVSVDRLYQGSDALVFTFATSPRDSLTVFGGLLGAVAEYTFTDGVIWTPSIILGLLDNEAPNAVDDGYLSAVSGAATTVLAADLLANDFDPDRDTLSIIAVDGGENGTAELDVDGNIVFTANGDFTGATTFTYTLSDGRNGLNEASVNIRVRPVAEARDDTGYTVAEDDVLVIRTERLLANDADGDRMVLAQVLNPTNGTVSLSSNGEILFTPDADYNGSAAFSYIANTADGGRAEARVFIDVTGVNDEPVALDDNGFLVLEGGSLVIDTANLLENDSDIDGDDLTISSVVPTTDLDVSLTDDGVILVSPRGDFFGEASFTYVVSDGAGSTAQGQVTVTVEPVNDAPVVIDDLITMDSGERLREDNPTVIDLATLLANDSDPDGDTLTVTGVVSGPQGEARLLENGTILFTPNQDFNGIASFDYTVDDGQGGSTTGTVSLDYEAVNDGPVVTNDGYVVDPLTGLPSGPSIYRGQEDVPLEIAISELLSNDIDPEGFALTFRSAGSGIEGDVEVTDRGTVIFTPDADFWGEASFAYLVADAEGATQLGQVSLWFDNVGDGPPVANTDVIEVYEDVPFTIPLELLLANDTDIDRDELEFVSWQWLVPEFTNGDIYQQANGDLLFTPDADTNRVSVFTYVVTDNRDGTDTGEVQINILPVDDQPTATDDDGGTTPFSVPLVLRASELVFNDVDVDISDAENGVEAGLTFVGVDSVSNGTYEIVAFGDETFIIVRAEPGFSGDITVRYLIEDETGLQDLGFATGYAATTYDLTLVGSDVTDLIEGTSDAETITGLAGDDLLVALGGNDTIDGGSGNDTIRAGDGDDVIIGGDGADTIDGGDGYDTVDFADSNTGVNADLESRIGRGGHAQGDVYTNVEALLGTQYADTLGGSTGDERLVGNDGDDTLDGRSGNDDLSGGKGDDVLTGGDGADVIAGGDGNDTASYELSAEAVSVSLQNGTAAGSDAHGDTLTSIENLTGSAFNDDLQGGDGTNILIGGRGDDVLRGMAGDDLLIGGRGADTLSGGAGIDIADYTLSAEGVTVDMADGAAGGGDATGDTFDGIEVIQGSYHNDILRGDGTDNMLRGGLGEDVLDGRGGFDTADYSRSETPVTLDLGTGVGTAGEAAGDTLISIEKVTGSSYDDALSGSTAADTFDGGMGNDTMSGKAGSDTYVFGTESGTDLVIENGDAADVDRIALTADLEPKDVSIIREGDDLLVEIEREGGLLIDTLRVTDHFLGRETGIEEISFNNGIIWDRDRIDALTRLDRFNAEDDILRLAVEDELLVIHPATLLQNDLDGDATGLSIVSVSAAINCTVTLLENGTITFLGDRDVTGDAFFDYTVRDEFGRESSATVEVNLAPVNDAPVGVDDGIFHSDEDQALRITFAELVGNDIDVDGDSLSIVATGFGPLIGVDGQTIDASDLYNATNGQVALGEGFVEFTTLEDFFGFAGFTYTLTDPDGLTSTAAVQLYFDPVNDAPRILDIKPWIRLETTTDFDMSDLINRIYDIEKDDFTIIDIKRPVNGTLDWDVDNGVISFTPGMLGTASFEIDVRDARGAEATLDFDMRVRPLNDAPIANDDSFTAIEDTPFLIDPADLIANDTDENGDTIEFVTFERFPTNGKVSLTDDGMILFTPRADYNGQAGFEYEITDGRGLSDVGFVAITVLPRNDAPILNTDILTSSEGDDIFILAAEAFGNDVEPDGDVLFFTSVDVLGEMTLRFLSGEPVIRGASLDNGDLPDWLTYNAETMTFSGEMPADLAPDASIDVQVIISYPDADRVFLQPISFTADDAAQLLAGIEFGTLVPEGYALREEMTTSFAFTGMGNGVDVSTTLADGASPLPEWLTFDADTVIFTGTPPAGETDVINVQLTFLHTAADGQVSNRSEIFSIDPTDPALAEGIAWSSDIALLDTADGIFTARSAFGRPLPYWLDFDADTMSLVETGIAPEADADIARVQLVFEGNTSALPDDTFSTATGTFAIELMVDPTAIDLGVINAIFAGDPFFAAQNRFALDLSSASDIAATLENGNALPDWLTFDAETVTFSGEPPAAYVGSVPVRMVANFGGQKVSIITEIVIDEIFVVNEDFFAPDFTRPERIDINTPDDFDGIVAIHYLAEDEKGGIAEEPGFIIVNVTPENQDPTANADMLQGMEDTISVWNAAELVSNDRDLDGDRLQIQSISDADIGVVELIGSGPDAQIRYAPPAGFSGTVSFDYILLDEAGNTSTGTATIEVVGVNDVPVAMDDLIDGFEDRISTIDVSDLLANDSDVDGDTLTITSVSNAFNGTVSFDGAVITFTPATDYVGEAGFDYTVSDGADGETVAQVVIDLASTNLAPTAGRDVFVGREDTPFILTVDQLLANDSDLDGDAISFVSIAGAGAELRAFTLPDGTIQIVPDLDINGVRTITYEITDGRLSSTGTIEVDFEAVNDAPVLNTDGPFETLEDTAVSIDLAGLLINDVDIDGDDFTIIEVLDGRNGTVEMVGDQAVFTPRADHFGNAGFSYRVVDAGGAEAIGSVEISVLPSDDRPITVSDQGISFDEDTTFILDPALLTANDYDPDGDAIIFLGIIDGIDATELGDGTWAITAPENAFGDISATYAIADGLGNPVTGTVTFTVLPVSDDPVGVDDMISMVEDEVTTIFTASLLANDIDVDGDALSFTGVSATSGIDVQIGPNGTLILTPQLNQTGLASFDYTLMDSTGIESTARVEITIAGVNDAPVVSAPTELSGAEDTAFEAQFLPDMFSDPDGDLLNIAMQGEGGMPLPDWLTFDAANLRLSGTPPLNANGSFVVELAVGDGNLTTIHPVTITLSAINDAPVATDDRIDMDTDVIRTIDFTQLVANDTDVDGDALTIVSVTAPEGVTVTIDGDQLIIERAPRLSGELVVEYVLSDGSLTSAAQLTLDVESANQAPVIEAITALRSNEDEPISVALPADAISDPDGDSLAVTATRAGGADLPDWLSFDDTALRFTGTPPVNFAGILNLQIAASDGVETTVRTFDLVIEHVNDLPILAAPYSDRFADEDTPFSIALQADLASDIDGDALTYDVRADDGGDLPGWVSFDADTFSLTGTPPSDFSGDIALRIFISDGSASISDDFMLTIRPINDAPVLAGGLSDVTADAAGDPLMTGSPFSIAVPTDAFVDPDGDQLAYASTLADGSPLPAWLTFDGEAYSGTAPRSAVGTLDLVLRASDGEFETQGSFALVFGEGNAAPVAGVDSFQTTAPGTSVIDVSDLLANDTDADGDALTITAVNASENADVVLDGDQITYTPGIDFEGVDAFTYTVSDGTTEVDGLVQIEVDNPYDDVEIGGNGSDVFFGGRGADYLSGGAGADVLFGGRGADVLNGGSGNDLLFGGRGGDTINGDEGRDIIFGGRGRDTITGGAGADVLFGGRGVDTFVFGEGSGRDTIYDFKTTRSTNSSLIAGDQIAISIDGIDSFAQLLSYGSQSGGGVLFDFGGGDELFLRGTQLAALDENQFSFF
ncbi:tandem-95 repeat protein [Ahrensia sp. R2A130]|uniref:tandem-95 repeat protein n=1 Tax=Ahrensia sp. R2A130 TaxID=744979 RepID=UPI0001E11294|nr:tandem-95 repeat protein [Ahrensia sp. R2A130]EFL88196.1 rhizobiocin RzcA [Ahrensia sp. R2A130]